VVVQVWLSASYLWASSWIYEVKRERRGKLPGGSGDVIKARDRCEARVDEIGVINLQMKNEMKNGFKNGEIMKNGS
jgi:hypothetical protein